MSQIGPIDRPIETPVTASPTSRLESGAQEAPAQSTTEVAKDQASAVTDSTKQAGQQVVQETKQQVGQVAAEAKNQTGNLLRQGVAEINSQAGHQQQRLAQGVHSIAQELGSMASSSDQSGPVTSLVQEASRRSGKAAHWLEDHEPTDILDGLRSFARRRPGTFLLGAAAAGVLVGRLTRGLAAEAKNEDAAHGEDPTTPGHALPSGYPAATDPIPIAEQLGDEAGGDPLTGEQVVGDPMPAGPEYTPTPPTRNSWPPAPPTPEAGREFSDDTLPRGLGQAGPR
jgi:hypothetical protein